MQLLKVARGPASAAGKPTIVLTWRDTQTATMSGDWAFGGGEVEAQGIISWDERYLVRKEGALVVEELLDELSVASSSDEVMTVLATYRCAEIKVSVE